MNVQTAALSPCVDCAPDRSAAPLAESPSGSAASTLCLSSSLLVCLLRLRGLKRVALNAFMNDFIHCICRVPLKTPRALHCVCMRVRCACACMCFSQQNISALLIISLYFLPKIPCKAEEVNKRRTVNVEGCLNVGVFIWRVGTARLFSEFRGKKRPQSILIIAATTTTHPTRGL